MDNVIQNISIRDIIPSNFQPTNEEKLKIEELAQLIKKFGILEPILVRPNNGKYEIILGIDKYQAALIANQNMIPAVIKDVNDEVYLKYSNIDKKKAVSLNSLPTNLLTREKNSDVINLSELSKIKLEFERDDLKMNNGQFNNEMVNNNFVQPEFNTNNQEPTFGGRFFPSLEDEPTNMNMMGGINTQPVVPTVPNMNNNLIDLTDLSIEKEQMPMVNPSVATPNINIPTADHVVNVNNNPSNNFNIPTQEPTSMPMMNENIINLESLQSNNPAVQPIVEPVSMDILNADFGAPTQITPQFNMGINNEANSTFVTENIELPQNKVQPELNYTQPVMEELAPQFINEYPQPSFEMNQVSVIQPELNYNQPELNNVDLIQPLNNNIEFTKNVTPVTNTIKNLVANLEAFGYKININEEDLQNVTKLTIEVEK